MDAEIAIRHIEDYLVPRLKLDVGETRLYYHLVRHSRLMNKHETLVSVGQMAQDMNCSKNAVKPRLRTLAEKGVIEIVNTGFAGTRLKVFLPHEIPGVVPTEPDQEKGVGLEALDFYKDQRYRPAIFEREGGKCFYCRRALSDGDYGLDHVQPQIGKGTNSYRNVVAACHSCNSSKGHATGPDHLRNLYRRGFLTADDLEERLGQLERLSQGLLRPIV